MVLMASVTFPATPSMLKAEYADAKLIMKPRVHSLTRERRTKRTERNR